MATRGIERSGIRTRSHEGFLSLDRFRWLKIALTVSLIALLGYVFADVHPRPYGGTWYGYTLGTIAALLILWLTMLGLRKRAMTPGRWSLKAWTSAHVYLGLALIVIATLHTGFQFGWNVHTLAYALMMLVILSGIYGIAVYSTLPEKLRDNSAEMTRPQMVATIDKMDQQLQVAAQPLESEDADLVLRSTNTDPFKAGLIRRLSGSYPNCGNARAIQEMRRRRYDAGSEQQAAIDEVLALLERKDVALTRIRRHMRIRAMLEVWLYVHVPITFATIAALTAHIISVFFYW